MLFSFLVGNRKRDWMQVSSREINEFAEHDMYHRCRGDNYKWGSEIDLTSMHKLFDWFVLISMHSYFIQMKRKPFLFIGCKIHKNKRHRPIQNWCDEICDELLKRTPNTQSALNYLISMMLRDIIIHSSIHPFIHSFIWSEMIIFLSLSILLTLHTFILLQTTGKYDFR